MQLTVKRLRELIALLPDDAVVRAYEGEGMLIIFENSGAEGEGWIDCMTEAGCDHDFSQLNIKELS